MPPKRKSDGPFQTSLRLTDEEERAFRDAASREGFDSIIQWMKYLANERSREIELAIAKGAFVTAKGRVVLASDINPAEIQSLVKSLIELSNMNVDHLKQGQK